MPPKDLDPSDSSQSQSTSPGEELDPTESGLPRAQIRVYAMNSSLSAFRVQGELMDGTQVGNCVETARDTQKSMNDAVFAVASCLDEHMQDGEIDGYFAPEGVVPFVNVEETDDGSNQENK